MRKYVVDRSVGLLEGALGSGNGRRVRHRVWHCRTSPSISRATPRSCVAGRQVRPPRTGTVEEGLSGAAASTGEQMPSSRGKVTYNHAYALPPKEKPPSVETARKVTKSAGGVYRRATGKVEKPPLPIRFSTKNGSVDKH